MSRAPHMQSPPLPGARNSHAAVLAAAYFAALLSGCALDETVHPLSGASTTTTTTTEPTTDTGGTGGTGGSPSAPIRTVLQRNPFGNVAATDNLLWDGDFEWSSPFSDQYGWLFGPPYGYAFPDATIGPACRSGLKCVTLPKNKAIIGIGVSSRTAGLAVAVFAKPTMGGCAGVDVSLLDIATSQQDIDVPATSPDPDAAGFCLYQTETPSHDKKVYLLVDNNTGAPLVVDDAVVRPTPKDSPPPPPPMAPMEGPRLARHDEARAAVLALRGPIIPPKSPAKRAFEEHLSR